MKKKLIIIGVILGIALAAVIVGVVRSRQARDAWGKLNDPKQLALDECLGEASSGLRDIFSAVCLADRRIDADRENCTRWSSEAILAFMNKQPAYPGFAEALAAWEIEVQGCYLSPN